MPRAFVRLSVNIPQTSGLFDYYLPESIQDLVKPGCLVEVPFGKQTVQAIVVERIAEPCVAETRPVLALLDVEPVVTSQQLMLADALAKATFSSPSAFLELMLPPGLRQHADTLYTLLSNFPPSTKPLSPLQEKLIAALKRRGPLRGRQLEASFPRQDWRSAAQALVRRGILLAQPVLPPPSVRPKLIRTVQLACPPQIAQERVKVMGSGAAAQRRKAIVDFLANETMPVAVSWVYAASGGNLADLRNLCEAGLVTLGETEIWRDPLENLSNVAQLPPQLTADQQRVFEQVRDALLCVVEGEPAQPLVLHGVTGSGKTEIYLQAATEALRMGRQVIVLVPEIALTPQTVKRFMERFPGQVGMVHSKLSAGERYDTWRRARAGQLSLIVGARSALFTPLPQLGLIVVDECHEDSYYQSEPPFYHAVRAALLYARLTNSVVLLGSATPPVEMLYQARREGWKLLSLPDRLLAHRQAVQACLVQMGKAFPNSPDDGTAATLPLPPVRVVDMRQELKSGNTSIFSRALINALGGVLAANQQAILYLNRRGSATYVFCRDCGYTLFCPRCNLPLTSHTTGDAATELICHHCNYRRKMPLRCPLCGGTRIRQYGTGTEKVEAVVKSLFPAARTLRWDADTVRAKGAHDIILSHFSNHRADVLIGTQMLAKGLDLPLVTLVGVVLADVGLNLPDFRAAERTFQLLTQVAGRAGRSPLGGEVILQTFNPDHYTIRAAAKYDFDGFYNTELEYRRRIDYPPFSRLVRLEYRHLQSAQAEAAAHVMAQQIANKIKDSVYTSTEIIGPVPCFFSRLNGYYRWQVIVRGSDPLSLLRGIALGDWRVEVDPPNLL
ncbi:MAG: primosomal protein N' [Anaerolineae bacterium]|nr:primosomal protein N' [Anaerolineae bacterium]